MRCYLALIMLLAIQAAHAAPDTVAGPHLRFFNSTEREVEVWIDDNFASTVAPKRVALLKVAQAAARTRVAVTAIGQSDEGYRLNAMVLPYSPTSTMDVTWGGIGRAPVTEELGEPSAGTPKSADLFNARWKELESHDHGKPFSHAETLFESAWGGKTVHGETIAARCDQNGWIVNSIGMLLVRIPNGSFTPAEAKSGVNGSVTLTRDYYIAVTETTVAQWRLVSKLPDKAEVLENELPIVSITWKQAQQFCETLADTTGANYCLPTEAQWEYACRAGESGPFSPASVRLTKLMWYGSNSDQRVHPVAQLTPNAYGLFDMHGNVRELCRDWWSPSVPTGVDPAGPSKGWTSLFSKEPERVRRGGSFDSPQEWCTCGLRDSVPPTMPQPWQGFRVVLELD